MANAGGGGVVVVVAWVGWLLLLPAAMGGGRIIVIVGWCWGHRRRWGWGGRASRSVAVDNAGGGVDIIRGTESKSVSNICITGGCSPVVATVDDDEDGCRKRKEQRGCWCAFLFW